MRYTQLATAPTPQTEPLDNTQVKNNAGGFVFQIDDWSRLNRFLILGSDAQTYYQSAQKLTKENARCVNKCYDSDYHLTIATIVAISDQGRAAKNDAAIFALALGAVHKDPRVRHAALEAMPKVCRTGTHLFQFVECATGLGRGWGRAMKRAVANWYNTKTVDQVAYQVIKYRQREGYTHKRLMQTAHPSPNGDPSRMALYQWLWGKENPGKLPNLVVDHLSVMLPGLSTQDMVRILKEHRLPWEALPTEALTKPEVWQAMLPNMGLTALIRNLGNMSRNGAITPLSEYESVACARIMDIENIRKSRVHPFNVLQALKVYEQGHGFRSDKTWPVSRPIVDALDFAFEKAFENVEPTGKRILIGLDVSGSMSSPLSGSCVSVAEAAAAMAVVTMRREKQWHVMAFDQGFRDLKFSGRENLAGVLKKTFNINGGGTDCSLPMIYALGSKIPVDVFMVITDNETWAGRGHPVEALKRYRKAMGINAKLVVMGMTSTGFSIADPNDAGMLDVVGMDASVPAVIADFIRQ